jgi:hypothetical protein
MNTESPRLKAQASRIIQEMIGELKTLQHELTHANPQDCFLRTTISDVPMTVSVIGTKNIDLHTALSSYLFTRKLEEKLQSLVSEEKEKYR